MPFTLQIGDEQYRIVGPDGEEGDLTELGSPASIEINGEMYAANYDGVDGSVYHLVPQSTTIELEVEFIVHNGDDNECTTPY